jgi:formylglycine-generating enzyme required for sulfatase activity
MGGPEPPARKSHGRDVAHLPDGDVFDLVGNVDEWMRDQYQTYSEPCWTQPGPLGDPLCNKASPSLGPVPALRGGSWVTGGGALEAASRNHYGTPSDSAVDLGFRCARPGL